jgi:hypothetical protein
LAVRLLDVSTIGGLEEDNVWAVEVRDLFLMDEDPGSLELRSRVLRSLSVW